MWIFPPCPKIRALIETRADTCVSIHLPTTPQSRHVGGSRIAFGNLTRTALEQLDATGFDERRRAKLEDMLVALGEDDEFWRLQANSLTVLATPDSLRTFRLATAVTETVEVSGRFHPRLRCAPWPFRSMPSCWPCRRTLLVWSRSSPICRRLQ